MGANELGRKAPVAGERPGSPPVGMVELTFRQAVGLAWTTDAAERAQPGADQHEGC
jgi:hypothetical protein